MEAPLPAGPLGLRRSVFWKVAGILVGVQLATGLLAVALSAWFAYDRSLDLVAGSLRLRLDIVAEEVEQRGGVDELGLPLRLDLGARFPDPVVVLDAAGRPRRRILPRADAFGEAPPADTLPLPPDLAERLAAGEVVVHLGEGGGAKSWGLAPLYDEAGFLTGGLLVQPLTRSIARELAGTRAAYQRALATTALLAVCIALVLGAFFTGRLVQPLRRMTRQVERIGAGDYAARLPATADDEIGRLAAAINQMAAEVEASMAALRATDALRRELVANVGHDLRTPLAALLGHTEEARRHLDAGRRDAAAEALAAAERQGRYLRQLVADLFELSVLDSPAPPLRREPIPPAELLTEAVHAHRTAYAAAGVALHLDLPPALPLLHADGVRLLRVLDNLLANALRHTPPGGTVRLSATVAEDALRVAVEDSGEGMAPEVLAHVFERYYRGQGARTRQAEGTGLGLSISRAIARAHGGELEAASTPGAGSTFTLRLPLAAP